MIGERRRVDHKILQSRERKKLFIFNLKFNIINLINCLLGADYECSTA